MTTPAEIWRYQGGGSNYNDVIYGASAAADNSVFLAGISSGRWNIDTQAGGGEDLSAAKLDSNGTLLWVWQEGSEGKDQMRAAAAVGDGGVVLAGYSTGTWNGEASQGLSDLAAAKLDQAGTVIWRWQDGTDSREVLEACVETTDGNVVVAGYSQAALNGTESDGHYHVVAVKLNVSTGHVIWTYEAGTVNGSTFAKGAAARVDGSVVLTGSTYGSFDPSRSTTNGYYDFAAVAIDKNGDEIWRWQNGTDGDSEFAACTALDDGSVILAGHTEGDWDGLNIGGQDFAMVKLNALGVEEWRWQGGTRLHDVWTAAATAVDDSIVLAGITFGNWVGTEGIHADGIRDFAAMAVDEEGLHLWSYQDGTDENEEFHAATVRPDGFILLAGSTRGTWTTTGNLDNATDYAAILVDGRMIGTPSPSTDARISSTARPDSESSTTPTQATAATEVPVSVPLPPTESLPTRTPSSSYSEPSTTSSPSFYLGLSVGSIAVGVAVLFILVVRVVRAKRQSAEDRRPGEVSSTSATPRHFPAAAPSSHGTTSHDPSVI